MSQERTRFPIQPKDVRRSAQSNRDTALDGHGPQGGADRSSDKPTLPPHKRHQDAEAAEAAVDDDDADGPTAG